MGCNSCTVACKDYYDVNPGPVRYRKQFTHEIEEDGSVQFYSLVISCNHCKTPACEPVCPSKAIVKRADGIVVVNRDKCIEARACIAACPFGEPNIADDRQEPNRKNTWGYPHPMQKCNLCVERLDRGEDTICVSACPMRAIEVGDYDELMQKHPESVPLTMEKFSYAYTGNNTSTGPSLLIKPKKRLAITPQAV
jgi:anaerobic dimethyl sulfoxide reductase subunit B (iron-sulfur subunit)